MLLRLVSAAEAEDSGTRGFAVTGFAFAGYDGGPADCPIGLDISAKDIYLQSLDKLRTAHVVRQSMGNKKAAPSQDAAFA